MRTTYDPTVDAMYIYLNGRPVHRTVQVSPQILVDLDEDDGPVGIEMLFASRVFAGEHLSVVHLELPLMGAVDVRVPEPTTA